LGWVYTRSTTPIERISCLLDRLHVLERPGVKGRERDLQCAAERMERGEFDLIAVGRALLSDHAWARKIRDGDRGALKGFHPSALAELV
jgi:2,4-dienoyl-CoA reductase-like NADH-dependent reductase (Old Yellow Enzyme family)